MNDIFVRAVKTFAQAFFATIVSELYILVEMDSVHLFGQNMLITVTPVICAALAAGFSAVGNALHGKISPSPDSVIFSEIVYPDDVDELLVKFSDDFKDPDFRKFVNGLSSAILKAYPEDSKTE